MTLSTYIINLLSNVTKVYTVEILIQYLFLLICRQTKKGIKIMLLQSLAKLLGIAQTNDIQNQMTDNSMELRLKHKTFANETTKIHRKYDEEQSMIQNQMDSIDDKTSDEYKELMSELKDSKDAEDKAVEQVEIKSTEYQDRVDRENAVLTDRLTAITENQEAWDSARKDNIEKTFGYFQ